MIAGKRNRVDRGLGGYPLVTLAEARAKGLSYRKLARNGIDPGEERRMLEANRRQDAEAKTERTFEKIARAKHESLKAEWGNEKHARQEPGSRPWRLSPFRSSAMSRVEEVDTAMVLKVLEPIWTTKTTTVIEIARPHRASSGLRQE